MIKCVLGSQKSLQVGQGLQLFQSGKLAFREISAYAYQPKADPFAREIIKLISN